MLLTRDGLKEPIIVTVERAMLNVPSVVVNYVGEAKNIAHLRIIKFGGTTLAEWDKAVSQVAANKETKGIVLDLRIIREGISRPRLILPENS